MTMTKKNHLKTKSWARSRKNRCQPKITKKWEKQIQRWAKIHSWHWKTSQSRQRASQQQGKASHACHWANSRWKQAKTLNPTNLIGLGQVFKTMCSTSNKCQTKSITKKLKTTEIYLQGRMTLAEFRSYNFLRINKSNSNLFSPCQLWMKFLLSYIKILVSDRGTKNTAELCLMVGSTSEELKILSMIIFMVKRLESKPINLCIKITWILSKRNAKTSR